MVHILVTKKVVYSSEPSGRAIHVLQISARIYGGIPGDHPCRNFLMISLLKFRGNEGEFSMFRLRSMWNPWGYFHVEISLVLPSKISKCNLMT